MDNKTLIKFVALDRERVALEEVFPIRELKTKYPKQWLQSRSDYQVFINSCMSKWIDEQKDLVWNVVTFEVV